MIQEKTETQQTTANKPQPKESLQPKPPKVRKETVLRFSPTAWAKLLYFRDHGETEIGGLGITRPDDLLFVEEFATVKQQVGMASISFDDEAVSAFFEKQVDSGRKPEQFGRIWLHTHPGDSPEPSSVDEETFQRVFGRCQWAVMFVLGKRGKTYARLRFNVGPGGAILIPVEVDYSLPFTGSAHELWKAEYEANVQPETWYASRTQYVFDDGPTEAGVDPDAWLDAFEAMDPDKRREVVDELASRPDLWDEESEVMF